MATATQNEAKLDESNLASLVDQRLLGYFRAGYPILYMVTAEEERAEQQLFTTILGKVPGKDITQSGRTKVQVWSCTEGMFSPGKKGTVRPELKDPSRMLDFIKGSEESGVVYIMRDLHSFFTGGAGMFVIRYIRDLARDLQNRMCNIVIIAPRPAIPPDLQRDVTLIEFDLPNRQQILGVFDSLYENNKKVLKGKVDVSEDDKEKIIEAAMGLTTTESKNAFSLALVDAVNGRGSIADLVLQEKALTVKKNGIIEYFKTTENLDSIGGLDNLKEWLIRRSKAFSKKAKDYGLPTPKGALLVGVPGGGKSLAAKCASAIMQVPLLRFDISRVFGGLVGQSEEQMRTALQTIDAIGPCVVWIDEIEKAFAGSSSSGSSDSGVTRRVFGNFLTWMQEKTTPSFVMATANSIIGIPPEMLRKGRFDENFFIDVPGPIARNEILKIHLKRRNRANLPISFKEVVQNSKGFTGAEIEASVVEGMFRAFEHDRDLETEDIVESLKATQPISVACADELSAMMKWAKTNAMAASKPDGGPEGVGRQLAV